MKAKPWGQIEEVDCGIAKLRSNAWSGLYSELKLRLEVTDPSAALAVPFGDHKLALSAQASLKTMFMLDVSERHGTVRVAVRKQDQGAILYVFWDNDHKLPEARKGK